MGTTWWGGMDDRPTPERYRFIKVYFPSSRIVINVDTVTFFLHIIPFPKVNLDDYLRQAAIDIIIILTSSKTSKTLSLEA